MIALFLAYWSDLWCAPGSSSPRYPDHEPRVEHVVPPAHVGFLPQEPWCEAESPTLPDLAAVWDHSAARGHTWIKECGSAPAVCALGRARVRKDDTNTENETEVEWMDGG